jgi:hypothetical protein
MKKILSSFIIIGSVYQATAQDSSKSSANGFKSYEGTMRDNLPIPTNASKKTEIFYPRPGEVSFSTQVWCGDGDVANYYAAHPNEVYNKGASTQRLAMGYWVTTGSQKIPDINSWFLMGYSDIPYTKGFLNELNLANSKNKIQASTILIQELNKLKSQFSVLSTIRDEKKINIYAGVMLCNSYQDTSGISPSKDSPTAATIGDKLVDYFKNKSLKDATQLVDGKIAKASFSEAEGGLTVQFVGGSSSNMYDAALKKLKDLDCKGVCDDSSKAMGDYRAFLNNNKLLDNLETLAASCQTQLKKGAPQYWWESVSMALDCQDIGGASFSDLILNFKGNNKSASDPTLSLDDFNKIKNDLNITLSRSALLKQVQDSLDGQNLSRNKGRCFPVGRPYIETLIASLPFSFTQKTTELGTVVASIWGSKSEMTMPEPDYALGAAAQYYKNDRAVFMSAGDPLIVDITKGLPVISFGAGVNFPMHVRDVGCSNGPGYCILKDRDHFFERLN